MKNIKFTSGIVTKIDNEYYDLQLYNADHQRVYSATLDRLTAAEMIDKHKTIKMLQTMPECISTIKELTPYNLVWDVDENALSAFCKTRKIGNEVYKILRNKNINVFQMTSEHRILRIYLHTFFINKTN